MPFKKSTRQWRLIRATVFTSTRAGHWRACFAMQMNGWKAFPKSLSSPLPALEILQIGDILVQKPVPESAKRKIDLWTG